MARILVIDDDASLLQMMSLMLKRAGHVPILVTNGREGIEVARAQQPDMAIVDVMMPDLSGYDVCRILREDPVTEHIPLLVLTALSQPEQRELAAESGADDFVTKPVTRDDLTKHVNELLETGPRNVPRSMARPPAPPPPPPPPAQPIERIAPPVAAPAATVRDSRPGTSPLNQPYPRLDSLQPVSMLPMVAVMALSGGAGATTLAVNLAMAMTRMGRTCLVDLNTQVGQVAVQLRMVPPRATWQNLVNIQPGGDKRQIGSALMLEPSAGLAVLAAPLQPVADRIPDQSLYYVLSVLTEGFPHIVVDLPSVLSPMNVVVLRSARSVVLVVGDDPTHLLLVPESLANVERLGLAGNVYIVMNHTRPHGITVDDVMKAINRPVTANLPYEPAQVSAVMQGTPLVTSQPDTLFSRAVYQLARQL